MKCAHQEYQIINVFGKEDEVYERDPSKVIKEAVCVWCGETIEILDDREFFQIGQSHD